MVYIRTAFKSKHGSSSSYFFQSFLCTQYKMNILTSHMKNTFIYILCKNENGLLSLYGSTFLENAWHNIFQDIYLYFSTVSFFQITTQFETLVFVKVI